MPLQIYKTGRFYWANVGKFRMQSGSTAPNKPSSPSISGLDKTTKSSHIMRSEYARQRRKFYQINAKSMAQKHGARQTLPAPKRTFIFGS
ncbi:hypothetical protein GCM10007385_00200 [Tateyamaria omphalii]|nr:hypothetical protein GCM10007385_00200 [Tateyamaria omphalii]